uniref:Uncharacterized protein n=1 Tax=Anguilla anguilla TaxID=7936 RepID=A0A0E9TPW5_ANGAN
MLRKLQIPLGFYSVFFNIEISSKTN